MYSRFGLVVAAMATRTTPGRPALDRLAEAASMGHHDHGEKLRPHLMALMAAGVLGATPVAVLAQEPSGETDTTGQRFEVPEFGYAVNLPADWVGIDSSDPDVAALVAGVVDQLQGPEAVTRLEDLLGQMAGPIASGAQVVATPLDEPDTLFCGVEARSGLPGPLSAWVEQVYANAAAGRSGFVVETGPRAIDLPSGPAWVVDGTVGDPTSGSGAYMAMYMLGGDGLELGVSCFGFERPDDDWLRFAESIEFLPASSTGPVVVGGRIEIPTAGFAIEVPDGWMGADLSHPDLVPQLESTGETGSGLVDALDGHFGSSLEDRVALGHEMVLWASPAGEGPENRQHCEGLCPEDRADLHRTVRRAVLLTRQGRSESDVGAARPTCGSGCRQ